MTGAAPWRLEKSPQASDPLRARVNNDHNESLVVHRDSNNGVILEFTTTARHGLGRSSCPTFQIDRRTPQHYFALGEQCEVAGATARYTVTTVVTGKVVSLVLYRLINGTRVAFRYISQDGTYHQSVFLAESIKAGFNGRAWCYAYDRSRQHRMTASMTVTVLDSLADIDPARWDQLAGDDPFLRHGFLQGLEATNCLGPQGWYPQHLAVFDGDKLCGAMPLYVRDNSYGEFCLRLELG